MTKTRDEPKAMWRALYRAILDTAFEDSSKSGLHMTPDQAIETLYSELAIHFPKSKLTRTDGRPLLQPRIDLMAGRREAHHYAVDLYYRTYFARNKGAPRVSESDNVKLLEARERGLTYRQIAEMTNLSIEAVRKRISRARRSLA